MPGPGPLIFSVIQKTRSGKECTNRSTVINTITYYIGESQGGSEADKAHIKAQAQMHRAYTYFDLVNMYAKQYDAATASTDPGVPVLLSPSLEQSLKKSICKSGV